MCDDAGQAEKTDLLFAKKNSPNPYHLGAIKMVILE